MRALLAALGHPERRWAAIHVAGTKGKGSTCAILASILRAAGVRVGLYTSPHLVHLSERIQTDGHPVTPAMLAEAVAAIQPSVAQLSSPPTYFEVLTAMAFWIFARTEIELAVLEVGVGGRLDATNVVDPLVSVITPVSLDHTDLLGSTLTDIAGEKAGIIKPGRPVVVAPQLPEALAVVRAAAAARGAPCVEVSAHTEVRALEASTEGQRVSLRTAARQYPPVPLPLLGIHQALNLATAVTALEQLPVERRVSEAAVVAGAAQVSWPGRLQILQRSPWVVADGAQNGASAATCADAVRALWPGRPVHLILGLSANKDLDGVAQALRPLAASVIATQARHPRALPAGVLAARLAAWCPAVETAATVEEAVARATRRAAPDDVVLVTGSLFLVGELLQEAPAFRG